MQTIKIDNQILSWFQTNEKFAFLGDVVGIMPDGTEVVGNVTEAGRFQFASDIFEIDGVEYTIISEVEVN